MEDINKERIVPIPVHHLPDAEAPLEAELDPNESLEIDRQQLLAGPSGTSGTPLTPGAADAPEPVGKPELEMTYRRGEFWGRPKGMLPKGTYNTLNMTYESLNYEDWICRLKTEFDGSGPSSFQIALRFPIMFFIGMLTGLTAFGIMVAIEYISDQKYAFIAYLLDKCEDQDHTTSLTYALFAAVGINLVFCLIGAILGVRCPVSCGSGIPFAKAYLNGVNIPFFLRTRTFIHKVIGVVCSVVGGLPVGKEGPMIHAGAILGGGFSQGISTTFNCDTKYFKFFRNDASKRDFVAGGAAAGVAAAFGAPLGGVLFAVEEGCSYMDVPILFQILVASCASFLTLDICKSLYLDTKGDMTAGGLISFGYFDDPTYNFPELFVFVGIGVIGGLLGAIWNGLNTKLTQFRMRHVQTNLQKVMEVCLWSIIVTMAAFYSMTFIKDCKYDGVGESSFYTVQLNCPPGKSHAGAAIWFETPETCVKNLFHSPSFFYNPSSLIAFTIVYFFISCVTYGLSISSGLFIPSLLIGASWGRLIGIALVNYVPGVDWGDVGKYSLMGAAAQLSGIVRLTISLCIILTEATGGITYTFPILVVVITAKTVGDLFNHGIYDIHLNLGGVPILDWHPPKNAHSLAAKDIMSTPVRFLERRVNLTTAFDALLKTNYSAFVIVDNLSEEQIEQARQANQDPSTLPRKFRALVLRHDILTMIFNNFVDTDGRSETWSAYMANYPRRLATHEVFYDHQPEWSDNKYLDFQNIMNYTPQTVYHGLQFKRVFKQFRSTGARHMVVINDANEVMGMITRKDLCRPVGTGGWLYNGPLKSKTMIVPGKGQHSMVVGCCGK